MSQFSDQLDKLEAAFASAEAAQSAAIQRANDQNHALKAENDSLKQQLASSSADDPALTQRLTDLENRANALKQNADSLDSGGVQPMAGDTQTGEMPDASTSGATDTHNAGVQEQSQLPGQNPPQQEQTVIHSPQ